MNSFDAFGVKLIQIQMRSESKFMGNCMEIVSNVKCLHDHCRGFMVFLILSHFSGSRSLPQLLWNIRCFLFCLVEKQGLCFVCILAQALEKGIHNRLKFEAPKKSAPQVSSVSAEVAERHEHSLQHMHRFSLQCFQ